MHRERYIEDDCYEALADALAALQPCPVEGRITRDQVKEAFGVVGNIWPQSILRDVILSATREAEQAFTLRNNL